MVCLGFEPGVAGWKAQKNPLSYGGTPKIMFTYRTIWKGKKVKKLDFSLIHTICRIAVRSRYAV